MADRLQELLQQRALIREHLEWLDAEIAASSGRPAEMRPPPAAPATFPPQSLRPAAIPQVAPAIALSATAVVPSASDEAAELIAKLAAQEKTDPVPTKKGCWILFCSVLAVFVAGAWALLHYFYRG